MACAWLNVPPGRAPAPPLPVITETEFKEFDIPASTINTYPGQAWGIAFRNTAFWADASTHYIDTTLLGYAVTIKATPRKYHWKFGDGHTYTSSQPGTKPPDADDLDTAAVTHMYEHRGWVTVNLTTDYTGMYKVEGQPWKTIPGTASVNAESHDLRVYVYEKYLVNHTCEEDPDGPDCQPPPPPHKGN